MNAPLPRLSDMECRKCGTLNPVVYLAPVAVAADLAGTCICLPCARARDWLDADDNLRPGIEL